jgi:hypothetical protein
MGFVLAKKKQLLKVSFGGVLLVWVVIDLSFRCPFD